MAATPIVIQRCAEPGCRRLTYFARCPEHLTSADQATTVALDDAIRDLTMARERFEEAERRVAQIKAALGVRGL